MALLSCTNSTPQIDRLNSKNNLYVTFSSKTETSYNITETLPQLSVSGECNRQTKQLKISIDNGTTWVLPENNSESDINCSDQSFNLIIKNPFIFFGFTATTQETKRLLIRGEFEDMLSSPSVVLLNYTLTPVNTTNPPSTPSASLDISNPSSWNISWGASTGTAPITYTVSRTTTYGSGYVDIPICISLTGLFCNDTTVSLDSTYCYKVTAVNIDGSSSSNEVCPPLSTPLSMTLTTNTNYKIPSLGGAPTLNYSIDSGSGSIGTTTGIFSSQHSGSTSVRVTDALANSSTINIKNIKVRTDGEIYSMIQNGSSLYIGGKFSTVNPTEAPKFLALNTDGTPALGCDLQSGFNDIIYTVLTTSSSIYVGGAFTQYRGHNVNRLAKLNLPNCDLDTTFSPPANNGFNSSVFALATSGTSLFVGGAFTDYKGIANSANYLAKLDLTTGSIDTSFSPIGPSTNGFNNIVYSLTTSGTSLFVGGAFTDYKGIANSANYLAKLDLTTGTIDTTFSPAGLYSNGFNNIVYSLTTSGSSLFVGGFFTAYKGITYSANYLAKLDLTTGTIDTTFSPVGLYSNGFNSTIRALAISGSNLFVGGAFTAYKGITNSANHFAKLDTTTGAIDTTFSPVGTNSNGFNGTVYSLAVSGSSLYVGGAFTAYKGIASSANRLAKLDITSGLLDTSFSPSIKNGFDNNVTAITINGNRVFIGGTFNIFKNTGSSANNIAKLDLSTGALDTAFSPPGNNGFDFTVLTLTTSGTSLYAGGYFTSYRGISNSANYLAKLDLTTGEIDTSFSPVGGTSNGFNNYVNSLAVSVSSIYVGGNFTAYKGIANSANRIAKLDITSGAIDTTFSPIGATSNGFNNAVNSLAVSGSSLYVGGFFTAYKGITNSANYLAKLDLTSGAIDTTFSPVGATSNGFNFHVFSLAISGSNLFVGGGFYMYRGVSNSANYLAKLDLTTGAIDTTFSPVGLNANGFENSVTALAISGPNLFVGGNFTSYKGVANSAKYIAKLDIITGAIDTTFSPSGLGNNGFNLPVKSLSVISASELYVGGQFTQYRGNQRAYYLVPLNITDGALLDP